MEASRRKNLGVETAAGWGGRGWGSWDGFCLCSDFAHLFLEQAMLSDVLRGGEGRKGQEEKEYKSRRSKFHWGRCARLLDTPVAYVKLSFPLLCLAPACVFSISLWFCVVSRSLVLCLCTATANAAAFLGSCARPSPGNHLPIKSASPNKSIFQGLSIQRHVLSLARKLFMFLSLFSSLAFHFMYSL